MWHKDDKVSGTIDCNSNFLTIQLRRSCIGNWYPLSGLKIEFPVVHRVTILAEFLGLVAGKFLGGISSFTRSGGYLCICIIDNGGVDRHNSSSGEEGSDTPGRGLLSHWTWRVVCLHTGEDLRISCQGVGLLTL